MNIDTIYLIIVSHVIKKQFTYALEILYPRSSFQLCVSNKLLL